MNEAPLTSAYRSLAGKRTLPTLDNLRVAAPCSVAWDTMHGNGRVRSCGECKKQVFNISSMTRADAEALLAERVDGVCVRFYRRFDGTILTADCPVGVKARVRLRAVWGTLVAVTLGTLSVSSLLRWLGTTVDATTSNPTTGFACATPSHRGEHER